MNRSFVFLLLVYITSSACLQKSNVTFRKDYKYFNATKSFYKFHPTRRSWYEAKKQCVLEGASLWYPENQAEAELVVQYWKTKLPQEQHVFVGISDLLSEGNFVTIDGKPIEDIWSNWGLGEPNNAPYHGGENCVSVRRDWGIPGNIDLNDENCEKFPKSFVCKKTLDTVQWNAQCDIPDPRYVYETGIGKCYRFESKQMNWTEAYRVCSAEQSYPAIINSEKERDILVTITADAQIDKNTEDFKYVHLGFHRKFGDEWETVIGTPLEDSGWNVWEKGQPERSANKTCGAMGLDGLYHALKCEEKSVFICEHDISPLNHTIIERGNFKNMSKSDEK